MRTTRRSFLKGAAVSAAAFGFPFVRARAASPNGKVNMAFIGIGCRGWDDFSMFAYYRDLTNVVALCDTQMGAPHTHRTLALAPHAPRYTDFRTMFDERAKEIDAVCIATPDFAHLPAAMLAMSLGKAVYCEKPLGNTFREIGLLTAAARRHGTVTQMGNQGHSGPNYHQYRALVRSGFLKDVVRIEAFMCAPRRWHKWHGTRTAMPAGGTPPPELAWDVWQSQRPARAFSADYLNGDWRSYYEYGTGALGDWGAHIFDTAWEFLELGLPARIELLRDEGSTPAVYPLASTLVFSFPARGPGRPACRLVWRDGVGNYPALPSKLTDPKYARGEHGSETYTADGRVFARGTHGAASTIIAGADPRDPAVKRALRAYPREQDDHVLNFLKAVKGEAEPHSPFSVAGPLSQVMALGALAQRRGVPVLDFDRTTGRFTNDATANAFLDGPPARAGWEQFERL